MMDAPATPFRDRVRRGLGLALGLAALVGLLGGCSTGLTDMRASAQGFYGAQSSQTALPITLFVASTRKDDRRAGAATNDAGAHFALNIVSVPPTHRAGQIETPAFGGPKADQHFVLSTAREIEPDEFQNQVATYLSGRVGNNRDILLFVHGFNISAEEARFRLAQIVADGRFGGLPVLFTWPSRANVFSYVSDKESATASRDALETLLADLSHTPGVGRIHVLAHSMGTWLAMEALRETAISGHPDLDGKLGDIMLAAPDIDLAVFRQQMARLGDRARISIFVSSGDRALALSSKIAGERQRVGALDPNNPRDRVELDRLGVKVYDLSSFSDGMIGHGAYADAPAVIRTIGAQLAAPRSGDSGQMTLYDGGVDRSTSSTPVGGSGSSPVANDGALARATQTSDLLPPVIRAPTSTETEPQPGVVTSEPLPPR